jgi:hypothetical protein
MRGLTVLLFIALIIVLAFWFGWFQVRKEDKSPNRTDYQFTIDKGEMKRDVEETEHKIRGAADKTREEIHEATEPEPRSEISIEKRQIEVEANSKTDVKVTRSGNDLSETQLKVVASPHSNLIVRGGYFLKGERQTVITIEAPPSAIDGQVAVQLHDGEHELVQVRVQTPHEVMMQWPPEAPTVRF